MRPTRPVLPLLFALLILSSCAKHKALRTFQPPPAPRPTAIRLVPVLPAPPQLAQTGRPEGSLSADVLESLSPAPEPPDWTRRPRRRASVPAPPPSAAATQPPLSNQPLRLGAMLSPEQQQQLTRQVDDYMHRARRNLQSASRLRLNANQKETADQIEVFLKQAEAARASDLEAARSLSERAELLSRDLLQSLR